MWCSVRKDSPDTFTLLIASADTKPKETHDFKIGERTAHLTVEYGDFADAMKKAADALTEVSSASRNEREPVLRKSNLQCLQNRRRSTLQTITRSLCSNSTPSREFVVFG